MSAPNLSVVSAATTVGDRLFLGGGGGGGGENIRTSL